MLTEDLTWRCLTSSPPSWALADGVGELGELQVHALGLGDVVLSRGLRSLNSGTCRGRAHGEFVPLHGDADRRPQQIQPTLSHVGSLGEKETLSQNWYSSIGIVLVSVAGADLEKY